MATPPIDFNRASGGDTYGQVAPIGNMRGGQSVRDLTHADEETRQRSSGCGSHVAMILMSGGFSLLILAIGAILGNKDHTKT